MTVTRLIGDGLVVESAEALARDQGVVSVPRRVLSERALELELNGDLRLATWLTWQFLPARTTPFAVESCSTAFANRAGQERSSMARAIIF